MLITRIDAYDLDVPYGVDFRPAWQHGLVRRSREFTLVAIRTDIGLVGYAGTDGHHATAVERWVAPYLVGADVESTEKHARVLRNAGKLWFIDLALWDLIGKEAGLPLYRLWGAARDRVRAYASAAQLGTREDRADLARRYADEGFTALKVRFHHDTLSEDLELYDVVASAVPDLDIMVDANQATNLPAPLPHPAWDYYRALETANELAARKAVWLEEPLPRYELEQLARLTANTTIHIAGGEKNQGLHEFRDLIMQGAYDIIQPDCTMSEGVSQLRKIAAFAELSGRHFVPHHGLSGLGLAGTLHLACSVGGMMWLEMMYEPPVRAIENYQQLAGIIRSRIWIDDEGYVRPTEAPGLGVEVDESKIEDYALRRSSVGQEDLPAAG